MTNKKGKRKGRKGKIKHDDPIPSSPDRAQEITASVDLTSSGSNGRYAQPSPRDDDLASPSTTTLLPDHESSPRGGQVDEINTRPTADQAPSRTLAVDDARSGKQSMECYPEDEDGCSSKCFPEDEDGCSSKSSSEDDDGFSVMVSTPRHTVMSRDLSSSYSRSDNMVSPNTTSGYESSPRYDHMKSAHNAGVLNTCSSSTTRSRPISLVLDSEHNAPLRVRISFLDAAKKGMLLSQNGALQHRIVPKEIRTAAPDNVKHHSTPPTDPRRAKTYVDATKLPPALPASHRAASGSTGTTTSAPDLASLESLEILDYSSEDHADHHFILKKLHASLQIRVGADFEKEEVPKIKEICEPHVGYLKSIQNLGGFWKKHRLVRRVKIFRVKMTILLATAQGSLLAQAMVAAIWECHTQKRSWNGTFGIEHIRIIKPRNSKEFMMILRDPLEFEGKALLQAKANDLDKAAAILQSLYMVGGDYAVFFEEFIQNLQQAFRFLVENELAFMEYLSYHPAIMPSTCRSTFVSRLSNIRTGPVMQSKSPAYPYDWSTIVKSEINGKFKDINYDKNKKDTDIIAVLYTVYDKNNYEDTVHGLIRFMRNVLEHGKQHDGRVIHGYELELYLAKMFDRFLPVTLRTMLMSGKMEEFAGADWSAYKISKWNNWEPAWSD